MTMPARIAAQPAKPIAPMRLPEKVARESGEHRLERKDQGDPRRADPPLRPDLHEVRERDREEPVTSSAAQTVAPWGTKRSPREKAIAVKTRNATATSTKVRPTASKRLA
jgi:hypothetical protein